MLELSSFQALYNHHTHFQIFGGYLHGDVLVFSSTLDVSMKPKMIQTFK